MFSIKILIVSVMILLWTEGSEKVLKTLGNKDLQEHSWYHRKPPILKVNGHNYDKTVIYHELQNAYRNYFNLEHDEHTKLYLGDPDKERKCIEHTLIAFYPHMYAFASNEFEASECRINLNPHYQLVVSPSIELPLVHHQRDPVLNKLESSLIDNLALSDNPEIAKLKFYDFDSINYNIDCSIDYQDLGQIKFKATNLGVTLDKVMIIPEECGFKIFDKNFDGHIDTAIQVSIPINGTFICNLGRSLTCKRQNAETANPRYKLFP